MASAARRLDEALKDEREKRVAIYKLLQERGRIDYKKGMEFKEDTWHTLHRSK